MASLSLYIFLRRRLLMQPSGRAIPIRAVTALSTPMPPDAPLERLQRLQAAPKAE
jgi:hypothetical protein